MPVLPTSDTHCTVMGLGRFGGGQGVTQWLLKQGCQICLTDLASDSQLQDAMKPLLPACGTGQLRTVFGRHDESDFQNTDLVLANPAVPTPWNNPYLMAAREAGVPITTEIRLLTERLDRNRVIGVTGTNGKSTTASMIHHAMRALGIPCLLGGNIGGSLLPRINEIDREHWIVLELSSAMLWWLGDEAGEGWSPGTAVTTNIAPNHLDWHETETHYRRCKQNITRFQSTGDTNFTGAEVPDQDISLIIPGRHNQANAALASQVVAELGGVTLPNAAQALHDFPGLPHRLQAVDLQGRIFNDSKATTPEATLLAVEALGPGRNHIHLIAGGYDKGVSLLQIAGLAADLGGLYTIGSTGPALNEAAGDRSRNCGTLEVAVKSAFESMKEGDVLLLSPGCASWDQFPHFEARGEAFMSLIHDQQG